MKRNILLGVFSFFVYIALDWQQIHLVEALLLLSMLCFVPIAMFLVGNDRKDDRLVKYLSTIYPLAALSAVLAIVTDVFVFSVVWFGFTVLITMLGLSRLLERGWKPISETAIDFGLIYLGLGGFWFFAYVSEIKIMSFSSLTNLLTAIHFHYSAFVIPIFMGFIGRKLTSSHRLYTLVSLVIISSPMTIAVGITISRKLEFIAVTVYVLALIFYAFFVFTAHFQRKLAKFLVSFSAAVLLMTIAFSLIYAFGRVSSSVTITIPTMIFIHGVVNAFGVVLPALVGWLLEDTAPAYPYYKKPMSALFGKKRIGEEFITKQNLIEDSGYKGLVDQMSDYSSDYFDDKKLSASIRDFYEHTSDFDLKANIHWAPWFKPFAHLYEKISKHVQQLHLGMGNHWETMQGEIIGVNSNRDGREKVRAWVRKNEQQESIFVALYSQHTSDAETYMNIALPLPFSNMTGILKLRNEGKNLILTSKLRPDGNGDEGIYLRSRYMTIRLPLSETFVITEREHNQLAATHTMWIFGFPFLAIEYQIQIK
ncbi:YndJ-like protein [Mesobacillus persicus]|uniref:YndJ-like protein n=1 Tax=Mesobacillus persicus TaxID=930146 RepID=A0A1H8ER67_9BACI|nr:YndJ family protein [Mesobacillus persicus]SEN22009.1 YndJ-like protein [Mesobacillus persicus]